MADTPRQEIKLFYCYARKDKPLRDKFEIHISWLKRRYPLTTWYDSEILPGEDWEKAIDTHLNTAHIILLLISPNFMASNYCYGKEMRRALERHKAGTCRVIPILIRPIYWEDAPFSNLQLLPTNARPITRWPDRDEAFQAVVNEISHVIEDLLTSRMTKEEKLAKINTLSPLKNGPDDANKIKTDILRVVHNLEAKVQPPTIRDLSRYLTRIDVDRLKIGVADLVRAGQLSEDKSGKSSRYTTIEETSLLTARSPKTKWDWLMEGNTLNELKGHEDALAAYEQAVRFHPNSAGTYATVHLFLIHNGKILLLRRFNTGYEDGNYSVIAGYLNGYEPVREAMIREAQEEAGIELSLLDLQVIGVMQRKPIDQHIDFFLAATTWSGTIVNKEPDKCDELAWFDINRLPKNMIPYIRRALDNYRQNDYRGMWFDTFD